MKKIVLTLLMTAMLAAPAFAQMPGGSMREHHREGNGHAMGMCNMEMCNMGMMEDMMGMCIEHAEKMGISDEQINKMKPVHNEMQKKQARFKADAKIAEIELKEIMEVKDFDLAKANSAAKKIAEIKTDHHLEMLKAMQEMRAILTDDQFLKMKKMMPMMMGGKAMDEKKPAKKMVKNPE